jgi:hypothetical protein
MTPPLKAPNLQAHQVLLYDRALHPELFPLRKRKVVRHGGYELEAWVMSGAHVLRFEHGPLCASELFSDDESRLPSTGIINAFLCITEREFEHRFTKERVTYMNAVQTENLSDNLYHSTYEELLENGRDAQALIHEWTDDAGRCLSMIEVQRYQGEVHVQCYHLLAGQNGLVLRTQSPFELR